MQGSNKKVGSFLEAERIVADAGGKLVGRTRLQKAAYLLELAGVGADFPFEYRHFGPYSEALADAVEIAVVFGDLDEKEVETDWGFYSIYKVKPNSSGAVDQTRGQILKLACDADAVVLELAATAAFLHTQGAEDPWVETQRRKPLKAKAGRLKDAKQLYEKFRQIQSPRPLPIF